MSTFPYPICLSFQPSFSLSGVFSSHLQLRVLAVYTWFGLLLGYCCWEWACQSN
ncbi:hypothetical protein BJX66DRAFT_300578 [Aspergillus keveii]|uniref:Uncharacterized protein n=1 Tax=Aspergillus keveii TaxID=714993 RepID=A0ABR4GA43_9EURO